MSEKDQNNSRKRTSTRLLGQLSVQAAARYINLPERTIRHHLKTKKLVGHKVGKEWFIARLSVDAFAQRDDLQQLAHLGRREVLYRRILAIEPNNERALAGLRAIERQSSVADLVKQAQAELKKGDPDPAARLVESALVINSRHTEANKMRTQIEEARLKEGFSYPTLKSKLSKPVTLEFRDANLKMVFDVLSRTSGINFVFDRDVR